MDFVVFQIVIHSGLLVSDIVFSSIYLLYQSVALNLIHDNITVNEVVLSQVSHMFYNFVSELLIAYSKCLSVNRTRPFNMARQV